MYRLVYFKATNVAGFMSGLSRKTVEIDLTKFDDKNLIIIFGDNASGKSTFMSLVHPWHLPTDGRTNFIVPGKEGTVLRTYVSDDGMTIQTKCVYLPKSDKDGHKPKCYFSVTKPGKDKMEELNPSGNIASYQALLYTYFGLNKEFIGFATYNPIVASIVKQSDTERKNSVGTMVPNTKRFEVSYNIVNDRYRELRTLMRSVSDKILAIRDEDSIKSDLKRLSKNLQEADERWRTATEKLGKAEGRLKELTKAGTKKEQIERYQMLQEMVERYDSTCKQIRDRLHRIYDDIGIDHAKDSIQFDGLDEVPKKIRKYLGLVSDNENLERVYQDQLTKLKQKRSKLDNEIMELQASIDSVDISDVDELKRMKKDYQKQLGEMEYTKNPEKYADMTYDEAVSASRMIATLSTMIQAIYDSHGDLVSQYLSGSLTDHDLREERASLQQQIEVLQAQQNDAFRAYVERDQYKKFQSILDQRPAECQIDTCPFVANAIAYTAYAKEANTYKEQYDKISAEIADKNKQLHRLEEIDSMLIDMATLTSYIRANMHLIHRYLSITEEEVMTCIEKATWTSVLDIVKMKAIAAVLSQKDLAIEIEQVRIPKIDHAIEMAKLYGTNRQLMISQIDRLKSELEQVMKSMKEASFHLKTIGHMVGRYRIKLDRWTEIEQLVNAYKDAVSKRINASEEADSMISRIEQIKEITEKIEKHRGVIEDCEHYLATNRPLERQMEIQLIDLARLRMEQSQIEYEFVMVDIIRTILLPGKGIRKELINIYMYDIYQTANQLLLHTFNGNLYLKEFIITDKEFVIPYVYNGTTGSDVSMASSSQQSAIAIAISMAILSKVLSTYGIVCFDEADAAFSPSNREIFIDILATQLSYIGIRQSFFITHHPEEYVGYPAGFIQFPGGNAKHIAKEDLISLD